MSIAGVVLASGVSARLGRPKQDVVLEGRTLLEHAVRAAVDAGLSPVLVVVRDRERYRWLEGRRVELVGNPFAEEGMGASVRMGVAAAARAGCSGVVLMTCDQPFLEAGHLRVLCEDLQQVKASGYGGRKGVPAYFPADRFNELQQLRGDQGARELLREAEVVAAEDLSVDVDTEDDLRRAEHLLQARRRAQG